MLAKPDVIFITFLTESNYCWYRPAFFMRTILSEDSPTHSTAQAGNINISQVEGRFLLFVVIKIMDGNPTIFIENVLTYYSGF